MYSTRTGLILGFHGCDKSVADKVLNQQDSLRQSVNSYDWLGNGIYFWENSPLRALEFARELQANPKKSHQITEPAVIGAVINLGFCLDLLEYNGLQLLKGGYDALVALGNFSQLPENKGSGKSEDLLRRELDCAIFETIHEVRRINTLQEFDSVRGVFWEGKELYPTAGFREKNHIQICVRNPNCIKGFFLPRELDEEFRKV